MRYFHYGSMQVDAARPTFPVAIKGQKLGVLEAAVGDTFSRVRGDISYVKTTIKQGTWGEIPKGYYGAGKVAGLLCVSQIDTKSSIATVWCQIGVGSNGKAFAELGWKAWWGEGAILKEYDYPIDETTVLEMVPKETISTTGTKKTNTVDFHFGDVVKTLTWDKTSKDWVPKGSGKPDFNWDDMNEIYWIRPQIEVYWSGFSAAAFGSKFQLPGTERDPFLFGPIKYEYKTLLPASTFEETLNPKVKTKRRMILGNEFSIPLKHNNDPNFEYRLRDKQGNPLHKIKLWGSENSESEEGN